MDIKVIIEHEGQTRVLTHKVTDLEITEFKYPAWMVYERTKSLIRRLIEQSLGPIQPLGTPDKEAGDEHTTTD